MAPPGSAQIGNPQIRYHTLPGRADVGVSVKAEPRENLVQRLGCEPRAETGFLPDVPCYPYISIF